MSRRRTIDYNPTQGLDRQGKALSISELMKGNIIRERSPSIWADRRGRVRAREQRGQRGGAAGSCITTCCVGLRIGQRRDEFGPHLQFNRVGIVADKFEQVRVLS